MTHVNLFCDTQLTERLPHHHLGCHLGPGNSGCLADERDRSGGPGVDFENVNDVILDRILDIHQTDHLKFLSQGVGVLFESLDQFIVQGEGRGDAGAVSGVDSRFFDMLHDAGNDSGLSVGDGIHINLDGILEKLVDEDRMSGRGVNGSLSKVL
jgi:hypothetical protein